MNKSALELHDRVLAESLENKTILITGATGLIGSNVVFYLAGLNDRRKANIKVVALYRNVQKRDRMFSELLDRENILFIKYDLADTFPYDEDIDYVIHAAGISGGIKMHLKSPVEMFDVSLRGMRNVLDFASIHHCKGFLYPSSYEVYGDLTSEGLIGEQQACQIDTFSLRSLHAEIKMSCESLMCAYSAQFGLPVYSARLTSSFGSGVQYDDPRFFAEFARCILENRNIVLKTDGKTVRSYLDVLDAATAFLYILTRGKTCNAYNVTNMGNEISIRDIALKMIEVSNSPVQLVVEKGDSESVLGFRKEGRTVMDASKVMALGWRPVYTLKETILSLIQCMKEPI